MRRTFVISRVLLPALAWALAGCRPSKAELAAVSDGLQRVRAEQAELHARVQQLEEREATVQAPTEADVGAVVGGLTDVARRLVVVGVVFGVFPAR